MQVIGVSPNLKKTGHPNQKMQKTHISNVAIRRFKGLQDVNVDLADFNVFIGANNSGKSSIIQALHFLISILQSSNLVRRWEKVDTSSISPDQIIYSPARDPYALANGGRLVESKAAESDIVIKLALSDGSTLETHVRKGKNNNISVSVDNKDVARRLSALDSPFSIFSPGLAGLAKAEPLQSDGLLLRALARGDANVILRNILYRLSEKPAEMKSFLDDLRLVFPSVQLRVDFDQTIDEFIDIFISLQDGGEIPLELAGTGLLQAIQILAYIHLYSPNIIVLDEPDSHLHPNNQRAICSVLSEMVAARGTQVVMTTHSRHVLDATVGRSKIFWFRRAT
ncbi:AAA family ATPase [uncultured Devosia sp.]|uniref:AAA family ATPase n=1 Tax=uncultured Devosia sp. TaxID=211434 RepID=UPI0035C9E414